MATLLFYLTAACFIVTSLAAPSSPPDAQLNGVSGPYFDGVEGADRAEVAGLLATLVFKSEDDITSGDVDDMAPRSELSLFVVMNEYKNDRLIRQSQCFQDLEHGVPHLQVSCIIFLFFIFFVLLSSIPVESAAEVLVENDANSHQPSWLSFSLDFVYGYYRLSDGRRRSGYCRLATNAEGISRASY